MRPSSRSLIVFLAGFVAGGVAAGLAVGRHWVRNFGDWQVGAVADQAHVAREIYAGRSKQLADQIRESLPMRVETIEHNFSKAEGRDLTYWMISDVYQVSGAPVPASLRPILAALPPRPNCKKPIKVIRGAA